MPISAIRISIIVIAAAFFSTGAAKASTEYQAVGAAARLYSILEGWPKSQINVFTMPGRSSPYANFKQLGGTLPYFVTHSQISPCIFLLMRPAGIGESKDHAFEAIDFSKLTTQYDQAPDDFGRYTLTIYGVRGADNWRNARSRERLLAQETGPGLSWDRLEFAGIDGNEIQAVIRAFTFIQQTCPAISPAPY